MISSFHCHLPCIIDPDEVAEWRNQRRKKFPTKQVTEEKLTREEQRVQAGGLRNGGGEQEEGWTTKKRRREHCQGVSSAVPGKQSKILPEEKVNRRGDEAVFEPPSCDCEEGDTDKIDTDGARASTVHNAGIHASAGASSSRNDLTGTKPCLVFQRKGRCKYGKKCHFIHDENISSKIGDSNSSHKLRNNSRDGKTDKSNKQIHNLFGKLVEHDMEKEDNMILQCFRHFVKTEFDMCATCT